MVIITLFIHFQYKSFTHCSNLNVSLLLSCTSLKHGV